MPAISGMQPVFVEHTPAELFLQLCQNIDKNDSGVASEKDVVTCLPFAGIQVEPTHVQRTLEECRDSNGLIKYRPFCRAIVQYTKTGSGSQTARGMLESRAQPSFATPSRARPPSMSGSLRGAGLFSPARVGQATGDRIFGTPQRPPNTTMPSEKRFRLSNDTNSSHRQRPATEREALTRGEREALKTEEAVATARAEGLRKEGEEGVGEEAASAPQQESQPIAHPPASRPPTSQIASVPFAPPRTPSVTASPRVKAAMTSRPVTAQQTTSSRPVPPTYSRPVTAAPQAAPNAVALLPRLRHQLRALIVRGGGELRRAFYFYDHKRTCRVSPVVFVEVMKHFKVNFEPAEYDCLFRYFDTSNSGTFNVDDFFKWFDGSDPEPTKPQLHVREPKEVFEKHRTISEPARKLLRLVREKIFARVRGGPTVFAHAFQFFDKNSDGFITRSEVKQVLSQFGFVLTEQQLNCLYELVDVDSDGKIDFYEFVDMIMPPDYSKFDHPLGPSQRGIDFFTIDDNSSVRQSLADRNHRRYLQLKFALDKFDPQGKGELPEAEFTSMLSSIKNFRLGEREIESLVLRLRDERGMVQFKDFFEAIKHDPFLQSVESELLKPRTMRSSGDIFSWCFDGPQKVEAKKMLPKPHSSRQTDFRIADDSILCSADVVKKSPQHAAAIQNNPLLQQGLNLEMGTGRRLVLGTIPSEVNPRHTYGRPTRYGENIAELLSNTYGVTTGGVEAHKLLKASMGQTQRLYRTAGKHTHKSAARNAEIKKKLESGRLSTPRNVGFQ